MQAILESNKGEVNAADPVTGMTALHIAVKINRENAFKYLLDVGTDPTIKNCADEDALKLAYKTENPKIIGLIKLIHARFMAEVEV